MGWVYFFSSFRSIYEGLWLLFTLFFEANHVDRKLRNLWRLVGAYKLGAPMFTLSLLSTTQGSRGINANTSKGHLLRSLRRQTRLQKILLMLLTNLWNFKEKGQSDNSSFNMRHRRGKESKVFQKYDWIKTATHEVSNAHRRIFA